MSILGSGIRMWRDHYGYDQRALADLVGVMQHHISRWETGAAIPSKKHLEKLCEVFNVDCHTYLVKRKDITRETDDKAFRQFFALPQEHQILIYLLIDALHSALSKH